MTVIQDLSQRKIMLFDLDCRGHHSSYILHLITYWRDRTLPGKLDIVVTPELVKQYPDILKPAESEQSNINFIAITLKEEANLKTVTSALDRFQRSFQEWRLVKKYIEITDCDHCLLMFLDSLLWRMSFGIKPSCSISSIFFRPIRHYRFFDNYQPSSRELFWEWREKLGLPRILALEQLENFFCLDPLAVNYFSKVYSETNGTNIVCLPDPVQTYNTSLQQVENLNQDLGIEAGRKVFLLFGSLSERKGLHELLEAIKTLSPELSRQLCLLIIGPFEGQQSQKLKPLIKQISQSQPIQIICHNKFVTDSQIEPYFKIADFVLTPYQRHVGMSAILVRAAAANKPVLSADFGAMGEVVRSFGLGITIDSEVLQSITDGLARCLTEPTASLCDYKKMKQFAEQNKAEQFAKVIFDNIFSSSKEIK